MAVDQVQELIGRQLDEFFAQQQVAALPTEIVSRFRNLVDAQPGEAFSAAFSYLSDRFTAFANERPRFESSTDLRYLQEVERWNVPGLAFLRPEFVSLAEILYERLLLDIRGLQGVSETRLHKGTPYHMLGMAKVLQERLFEAHDYFVLAAFEDALLDSNWRAGPAATMLDAHWNGPVEFESVAELAELAHGYEGEDRRIVVWNPELLLMLERAA